ncbi:hypothetical protein [Bradyrhizobium sp. CCBAU 11361]|uniref:hypothetical protein n=1 Tax=Bradyrhizobium sp. CCBAU 11361 TaxID=1630812 RepID=UPI00230271CD|nr:hypothetical protein [Bradyrhizobium sp. CCBAU 11361]
MLVDKIFGSLNDPARIGAAGNSLGSYTVLAVADGISDPELLQVLYRSPASDVSCRPPPPAAVMRCETVARLSADPDFRQRYSEAGKSYRDERIRAVFAMAPGARAGLRTGQP